jgi:hypothetical protein
MNNLTSLENNSIGLMEVNSSKIENATTNLGNLFVLNNTDMLWLLVACVIVFIMVKKAPPLFSAIYYFLKNNLSFNLTLFRFRALPFTTAATFDE